MIIQNATIIDELTHKKADVRIKDGIIEQIESSITPLENETVINADGLWLLPGAIDINVGLGVGAKIASTLDKIMQDAIKGGVTTLALMPDVAVNSEVGYDYFASKAVGVPSVLIAASSTENNAEEKLNNLSFVFHEGAIGVHSPTDLQPDYLKCVSNYAAMHNKAWFVRAQNKILDTASQMNEGKTASMLGLGGFLRLSEASEIAKICEYARDANAKIVIEAISSSEGLGSAKRAKASGVKAYLQATIAHLLLDDTECLEFNSYAKIYPPLRETFDRDSLINACVHDDIDAVVSAHRPVSNAKKEVSFDEASFGIESIDNFWSLVYTALHDKIDIQKICRLVASSPANILGLQDRGMIAQGLRADVVLFNPSITISGDKTSKNPLLKLERKGVVIQTICAEQSIW